MPQNQRSRAGAPRRYPDLYMPAMPPVALIEQLHHWVCRRRMRRLLRLDDHRLRDLGYSRADLLWALRQPLSVNAMKAIARRT